jgi:hypothetical protein
MPLNLYRFGLIGWFGFPSVSLQKYEDTSYKLAKQQFAVFITELISLHIRVEIFILLNFSGIAEILACR